MATTDILEASEMTDHDMPVGLASLPTEILLDICEVLANTHAQSLVAFARTSRRYYQIAQSLLVRTVRIDDDGSDADVTQSITECLQRLRRDRVTDRVQRLVLGMKSHDRPVMSRIRCADMSTVLPVDEHLGYETAIMNCYRCHEPGMANCWVPEPSYILMRDVCETEVRWDAIIGLIKELPRLMHLVFACNGQFPIRLLRALTAHHPTCKLHLYKFNLWSGEGGWTISKLWPQEREFITSPLIHTINDSLLSCWTHSLFGGRSETLERLVRGLTPNLKVFRGGSACDSKHPEEDGWVNLGAGASRIDPPGGTENMDSRPRIESLEYLELHTPPGAVFKPLRDSVDVSCLRALKLNIHRAYSFTELAELLNGINIDRLETLSVINRHSDPEAPTSETLEWFPDLVGNLKSLELGWFYTPLVSKIASPALRKLHLVGECDRIQDLSRHELVQLGRSCPQLEDLRVPLRRSKGSAEEVACYAALGRFFPRLRHLSICLLCQDPQADPSWWDLWPLDKCKENLVVDFLISLAVDGKLAASIFDVISSARSLVPGKLLLETLTVGPLSDSASGQWKPMVISISRKWHVERDVRDDRRDKLRITEVDIPKRYFSFYAWSPAIYHYHCRIYQKIWGTTSAMPDPDRCGPGIEWPWLKGWHSFPLDIEGFKRLEEDET